MIKILFILPSLKAGGAERVISYIAANLNAKDFQYKLLILARPEVSAYDYDEKNTIFIGKGRLIHSILPIIKTIRHVKPQIVVSSIGHVNILCGLFAFFFKKILFVGREASVTTHMNKFASKDYQILKRKAYKGLSKIICQSNDMSSDLKNQLNTREEQIVVINNPITFSIRESISPQNKLPTYITVGRLSAEKGHERILNVLSKLKFPFTYNIVGTGPLEEKLRHCVENLGLRSKVNFIGYSDKIPDLLAAHDYFIQGSYVEGFPNAVLESCMVGTPVIAFIAPGGTKEIIKNGVNGFLVQDEDELYSILVDKELLMTLERGAIQKSVIDKFSGDKIVKQYEDLFKNLLVK